MLLSVLLLLTFSPQQGPAPDYASHFNRALELISQQKDDEAIGEFRKTLELSPGLYEAQLNLGTLLLRNGRPAEALPLLKEASAARPQELRPGLYYAQALFDTGDAVAAEPYFTSSLALDPASVQARVGLARILSARSEFARAEEHYRAAGALPELASMFERAGKHAEALAVYRELPENPIARKRLAELEKIIVLKQADAFRESNQPERAVEQLRLALGADPSNFDLRMGLARLLRDEHKYAPAAQEFIAASKLKPDSVAVWNELAAIFVINKSFPDALTALDRARALAPETAGQLYFRALALDSLKQHKPALEAYQRFLAAGAGKLPDEEFLARQRIRIIESEMKRR